MTMRMKRQMQGILKIWTLIILNFLFVLNLQGVKAESTSENDCLTGLVVSMDIVETDNGYELAEDATFSKEITVSSYDGEECPVFIGIMNQDNVSPLVSGNFVMISQRKDVWTNAIWDAGWHTYPEFPNENGIYNLAGEDLPGDYILTYQGQDMEETTLNVDEIAEDNQVIVHINWDGLTFFMNSQADINDTIDDFYFQTGQSKKIYALYNLRDGESVTDYEIKVGDYKNNPTENGGRTQVFETLSDEYYKITEIQDQQGFEIEITDKAQGPFAVFVTINTNIRNEDIGNEIYNTLYFHEVYGLQLLQNPTKTNYVEGEYFNSAGMQLVWRQWDFFNTKISEQVVENSLVNWNLTEPLQITDEIVDVTYTYYGITSVLHIPITVSVADIKNEPNDGKNQDTTVVLIPTGQSDVLAPTEQEDAAEILPEDVGTILTDTKTKAKYKVTSANSVNPTVAYIKSSSSTATSVTIPASVTVNNITYKVTSIAASAFKNNKKLAKVTIGKNVTMMGANAFSGCSKLKTVILPSGSALTAIGEKAFYQCTALTKITIPVKVKTIGNQAFYRCKKLKTVTIQTTKLTTKTVGAKAFSGIYAQATIKVPKSKLFAYKTLLKKKGITGKKQKIQK